MIKKNTIGCYKCNLQIDKKSHTEELIKLFEEHCTVLKTLLNNQGFYFIIIYKDEKKLTYFSNITYHVFKKNSNLYNRFT